MFKSWSIKKIIIHRTLFISKMYDEPIHVSLQMYDRFIFVDNFCKNIINKQCTQDPEFMTLMRTRVPGELAESFRIILRTEVDLYGKLVYGVLNHIFKNDLWLQQLQNIQDLKLTHTLSQMIDWIAMMLEQSDKPSVNRKKRKHDD